MNKLVVISAVLASLVATEAMADTHNTENNDLRIEQTDNYECNGCVFVDGKGSYRKMTRKVDRYEDHTYEVIEEFN